MFDPSRDGSTGPEKFNWKNKMFMNKFIVLLTVLLLGLFFVAALDHPASVDLDT